MKRSFIRTAREALPTEKRSYEQYNILHRNRRWRGHRVGAGNWSLEVSPLAGRPEAGASHQEKDVALTR